MNKSNEGQVPTAQPSWDQIVAVLTERVNPRLASHDGSVQPIALLPDGTLKVRFGGACQFCPASEETLNQIVMATLQEAFPNFSLKVQADHSVSEDLIQQAKAILNKEKDRKSHL